MTSIAPQVTDLRAGTWTIDPAHSEVSFAVRHMMIASVRGYFSAVSGSVLVAQTPEQSSVQADIEVRSLDSRNPKRDEHLLSGAFFDAEKHPVISFRSRSLRDVTVDSAVLAGDLTVRGCRRPVDIAVRFNGVATDPWGTVRAGFSGETSLDRRDFGLVTDLPVPDGTLFISHEVAIRLEIEVTAPA
jgi:polyisoprenoid-binding protein YceI